MEVLKLAAAFTAGLLSGLALCWNSMRSLRSKVKVYETYIHERISTGPTESSPGRADSRFK
jgi:hypothetical protein